MPRIRNRQPKHVSIRARVHCLLCREADPAGAGLGRGGRTIPPDHCRTEPATHVADPRGTATMAELYAAWFTEHPARGGKIRHRGSGGALTIHQIHRSMSSARWRKSGICEKQRHNRPRYAGKKRRRKYYRDEHIPGTHIDKRLQGRQKKRVPRIGSRTNCDTPPQRRSAMSTGWKALRWHWDTPPPTQCRYTPNRSKAARAAMVDGRFQRWNSRLLSVVTI